MVESPAEESVQVRSEVGSLAPTRWRALTARSAYVKSHPAATNHPVPCGAQTAAEADDRYIPSRNGRG